jgi:hypothetical protein
MYSENYHLNIDVRDSKGKIIRDADGIMHVNFKIDLVVTKEQLEREMIKLGNSLMVWMPKNKVNIDASVFNSISGTWMTMYSYYATEKRFVKH